MVTGCVSWSRHGIDKLSSNQLRHTPYSVPNVNPQRGDLSFPQFPGEWTGFRPHDSRLCSRRDFSVVRGCATPVPRPACRHNSGTSLVAAHRTTAATGKALQCLMLRTGALAGSPTGMRTIVVSCETQLVRTRPELGFQHLQAGSVALTTSIATPQRHQKPDAGPAEKASMPLSAKPFCARAGLGFLA